MTVALPVRDGAATLNAVLAAVRAQRIDGELELLVCDSGSHDGSLAIARRHAARVIEIPPDSFAHGPTRNLLMEQARGEFVALLTQDAEPVGDRWLAALLSGFSLADDVALVYGPYRPRPGASPVTRSQLERWFASLSPDGSPRLDRLTGDELHRPAAELFGRQTFFTDANACVRRAAWESVPFRELAYAEDQALALDMMRGGYAKAFVPQAAVLHSHDYGAWQLLRRSFDEWRGLLEVYGWREPISPRRIVLQVRGELGAQRRELRAAGVPPLRRAAILAAAMQHHVARQVGALAGSQADRLPARVRRSLSLEGRDAGPNR